jgi:hypothetical protein
VLDSDRLVAVYTLCGLLVLWVGWIKAVRPKIRRFRTRWNQAGDALLGRDPIVDTITGREVSPALPGIGQRMATVEDAVKTLTDTVARLDAINERLDRHEAQIGTNTENIAAIMVAAAERIITKDESAQMWRAIADKELIDGESSEEGQS